MITDYENPLIEDINMNPEHFRNCMSNLACTVTIIATQTDKQIPVGLTVTSLNSVSLNPSLISICLSDQTFTLEAIRQARVFSANIMDVDQVDIADRFARPIQDKFSGVAWSYGKEVKVPIINDSLVNLECDLYDLVTCGDHVIVIGEVKSGIIRSGSPLLYSSRRYCTL